MDQQPNPNPNSEAHITDLVVGDMLFRKQVGIKTYGTPLQSFNGRDALQDAYEEVLDLAQYMKQQMLERAALYAAIEAVITAPSVETVDQLKAVYLRVKQ